MDDRACENTHPSRAANMAIHGLNSAAASDFMDNEDSQAPLKASVLSGYRVIHGAFVWLILSPIAQAPSHRVVP
jgi:malate synthase